MADKKRIYEALMQKAKTRINLSGYAELHHILPVSMGGSNDASNLVALTAKEHYLAHRLLAKFTTGRDQYKMIYALKNMMMTSKGRPRYFPCSRVYDNVRNEVSKAQITYAASMTPEERSERFGVWKGNNHSEETKRKMSASSLGVKKSAQHAANISASRKEMKFSKKHIEHIRQSLIGTLHTEERKKNTSTVMKQWWAQRKECKIVG